MTESKIAKIGEEISWEFDNKEYYPDYLRGKKFKSTVAMVDIENRCYGVYAEYGQDLIGFENAIL